MQSEAGSRAGVQGGTACWLSMQVMPEAAVKPGLISDISCHQKKKHIFGLNVCDCSVQGCGNAAPFTCFILFLTTLNMLSCCLWMDGKNHGPTM